MTASAVTQSQAPQRPASLSAPGRHPSAVRRLIRTEIRLMVRDPLTLTFVLAFPIVTMLIIGGSFGRSPDDAFGGTDPAHWYVASYLTVVIGATGLVSLPVHIASYRERGVLRRLAASGFPRWSFAIAQLLVGLATIVLGAGLLLAVAAPVYGVPSMHDWGRASAGMAVGSVAFVSLGVLLGTVLRSARSAQAVGLLLFFPSFLLGVGGPPPAVMGSALKRISDVLPLAMVTNTIREPWLGIGHAGGSLLAVSALAVVALTMSVRRTAL
jgi:ABC-2 type transport system permease protein